MSSVDTYCNVRHQPTAEEIGLPPGREFVLFGLFVTWLADNGFLASRLEPMGQEVKARKRTGPELLADVDGVLDSTMVAPDVHGFCRSYYCLMDGGAYLPDFQSTFGVTGGMPKDLYAVEDSWSNYDKIAPKIDAAFRRYLEN